MCAGLVSLLRRMLRLPSMDAVISHAIGLGAGCEVKINDSATVIFSFWAGDTEGTLRRRIGL